MNKKVAREMFEILSDGDVEKYEFAATKDFEQVMMDERKYTKAIIKKYIDYFNDNFDNAIGKYEDIYNDVAYKYTVFSLDNHYLLYTSWVAFDTEKIRMYKWVVAVLNREGKN